MDIRSASSHTILTSSGSRRRAEPQPCVTVTVQCQLQAKEEISAVLQWAHKAGIVSDHELKHMDWSEKAAARFYALSTRLISCL